MIKATHEQLRPVLERRDHGFRWRGRDISRIEGLSDAVFAFAVTLLVVSLEAPKTFHDLTRLMHGFVSFGICFALLLMIWHAQYIYFRRYALDDKRSFLLNAALLFVVAFYVYPLKFLFTVFSNALTGYHEVNAAGLPIEAMKVQDWRPLMLIYGAGFIALYVIFALLYLHAYKLRDELALSPMEAYETRGVVQENLVMIGIGTLSVTLAAVNLPQFAGMAYVLIGPLQTWLGVVHGKGRRALK
ncbi:MAG: TMEM175 family protein [bacterium]